MKETLQRGDKPMKASMRNKYAEAASHKAARSICLSLQSEWDIE